VVGRTPARVGHRSGALGDVPRAPPARIRMQ
jgi:hypothetical protein